MVLCFYLYFSFKCWDLFIYFRFQYVCWCGWDFDEGGYYKFWGSPQEGGRPLKMPILIMLRLGRSAWRRPGDKDLNSWALSSLKPTYIQSHLNTLYINPGWDRWNPNWVSIGEASEKVMWNIRYCYLRLCDFYLKLMWHSGNFFFLNE